MFHIHVGYHDNTKETNREIAKAMDLFLGVPSVLMEPVNERRKVGYGCAGNYRHQKHGMEYRSLSSYFSSEQKLIEWCFGNTQAAIKFVEDGLVETIDPMGDLLQSVINSEDKDVAKRIVERFNIPMCQ